MRSTWLKKWLGGVAAGAFALLAVASAAHAQTATGNVRGYVTGPGGAPLGNAQVGARMISTNQTRGTMTTDAGFYYLAGLRPGQYEITVRRIGMQPQTRTIAVQIGVTTDLNFSTQEVATQLEAVQVVAAVTGTTTKTSEVGTNISREQINNLPNFERNVLDLAKLAPGASAQSVNSSDKFFAAGGQPAEAINIFVDGATYKNDVLKGGTIGQDASKGNPLPQGAIQEFRILTQNYKAEYQKAASAVIVATTRSGSNTHEADFFAYGVGKAYVAKDPFTALRGGARPNYQRLQAGGNVGGPLIQDKLFYFGTYELNFRDEPAYILLGSQAALASPALRQQLAGYTGQQAQEFREHLGLGKLTWNASEQNTADISFTLRKDDDFRGFGGQTAFEAAENVAIRTYTTVANWKHTGARWLNEFQVNGQYFTWNPTGRNFGLIGKDYQGLLRIGGKDSEQDFRQNRISVRNDVTRGGVQLGGEHVFKMGGSVDFLAYKASKYFNGNPVFRFHYDSNTTTNVVTDRWTQPFEAGVGFGDPDIESNNTQFGVYAQDDWSIGRNLVLNLGLRWDGETNMINNDYVTPRPLADSLRALYNSGYLVSSQDIPGGSRNVNVIGQLGGIENFVTSGSSDRPWYKKAFQPRVGASYDLMGDGRWVLFGGTGLYYDRNYWNTLLDEQFRRQYSVINVRFSNSCGTSSNCVPWDPKYYDPDQLRQLAVVAGRPEVFLVKNDMTPPSTVQSSVGVRHQWGNQRLTLSYNGIRGRNYMNFIRGGPWESPGTPYWTVFVADDRVKTWYDAVQFQIERPVNLITRWGGSLAYTLGKSEEQGQSQDIFWGFDGRYPTVADRPRLRAPGDQRHAVVANGMIRLPFDMLAAAIVNLGSGITVNASNETRGGGVGERFTYTFTPPSRPFLGLGHVFAYQNLDLRLQKDINFLSGQQAALVVDVFNALNSANWGCYETTIRASGNQNYGKPNCSGLGRRLQLGLRYGWRQNDGSR